EVDVSEPAEDRERLGVAEVVVEPVDLDRRADLEGPRDEVPVVHHHRDDGRVLVEGGGAGPVDLLDAAADLGRGGGGEEHEGEEQGGEAHGIGGVWEGSPSYALLPATLPPLLPVILSGAKDLRPGRR